MYAYTLVVYKFTSGSYLTPPDIEQQHLEEPCYATGGEELEDTHLKLNLDAKR